jgi:hypothetical protein
MNKIKSLLSVFLILTLATLACKKEDLPFSSVNLELHGDFNGPWHGLTLDPNMPSLCSGKGTESKIRILAYARKAPQPRGDSRKNPGAWIHTQPFKEGYTDNYQPIWFWGETKKLVSCDQFEVIIKEKKYDPTGNQGTGAFLEGDIVGVVDAACIVTITSAAKLRSVVIKVKSKLTSEQIFPENPNLPVKQKTEFEQLFVDCGA